MAGRIIARFFEELRGVGRSIGRAGEDVLKQTLRDAEKGLRDLAKQAEAESKAGGTPLKQLFNESTELGRDLEGRATVNGQNLATIEEKLRAGRLNEAARDIGSRAEFTPVEELNYMRTVSEVTPEASLRPSEDLRKAAVEEHPDLAKTEVEELSPKAAKRADDMLAKLQAEKAPGAAGKKLYGIVLKGIVIGAGVVATWVYVKSLDGLFVYVKRADGIKVYKVPQGFCNFSPDLTHTDVATDDMLKQYHIYPNTRLACEYMLADPTTFAQELKDINHYAQLTVTPDNLETVLKDTGKYNKIADTVKLAIDADKLPFSKVVKCSNGDSGCLNWDPTAPQYSRTFLDNKHIPSNVTVKCKTGQTVFDLIIDIGGDAAESIINSTTAGALSDSSAKSLIYLVAILVILSVSVTALRNIGRRKRERGE